MIGQGSHYLTPVDPDYRAHNAARILELTIYRTASGGGLRCGVMFFVSIIKNHRYTHLITSCKEGGPKPARSSEWELLAVAQSGLHEPLNVMELLVGYWIPTYVIVLIIRPFIRGERDKAGVLAVRAGVFDILCSVYLDSIDDERHPVGVLFALDGLDVAHLKFGGLVLFGLLGFSF